MDKFFSLMKSLDPLMLGLFGLGILIILGVLLINWLQTRKLAGPNTATENWTAPTAPAPTPGAPARDHAADPMERVEPTLSGRPVHSTETNVAPRVPSLEIPSVKMGDVEMTSAHLGPVNTFAPDELRDDPVLSTPCLEQGETLRAEIDGIGPTGPREPTAPIDGRVHSIVKLRFPHTITAPEARAAIEAVAERFSRGQAWVWSATVAAWTNSRQGHGVALPVADAIAFAMPLATRNGAVSESTLRDWMAEIESQGHALKADVVYAPIHDDCKRAVELDSFCGALDLIAQVNLTRADHSAITGTRLRGTLEAEGFHLNDHGAFEFMSEDGQHVLYEIHNAHGQPMTAQSLRSDGVHGLSLTLDVMRVPNPAQHFDLMRALAKRLATRLESVVVDDRGHAITDNVMLQIRAELDKRVAAARAAGIEPGSPLARTLFGQ